MKTPVLPRNEILKPNLPEGVTFKQVGAGGVGGILTRYATKFLASLEVEARYVLVDGDIFETANAGRMFFGASGVNKAAALRDELRPGLANSRLAVQAIEEFITPENISRLLHQGDVVLLTVDNHATRKLVNDYCATLQDVCLISGGNDGVGPDGSGTQRRGTYGNVQIYLRGGGQDLLPPLTRFHPEIQAPEDHLPTELSCTELAASVPQILFANLMVASAMLNTLWLYLCGVLHYSELAFDIAEGQMRPIVSLPEPRDAETAAHTEAP